VIKKLLSERRPRLVGGHHEVVGASGEGRFKKIISSPQTQGTSTLAQSPCNSQLAKQPKKTASQSKYGVALGEKFKNIKNIRAT
jgi:hypothetical protein